MKNRRFDFANEKTPTSQSPDFWKRKAAMAIGKPELADASDDDLEAAHDAHMCAMTEELSTSEFPQTPDGSLIRKGMPPGPAAVVSSANSRELAPSFVNENQRLLYVDGLIRAESVRQGISNEVALLYVRGMHPDLFPERRPAGPTPEQKRAETARRANAIELINDQVKNGTDYDPAFHIVRAEHPHLFPA